jgi:hypothetical protein
MWRVGPFGFLGALLIVAAAIVVVALATAPVAEHIQCDGWLPGWMLERGEYEGGGCAVVYPSSEAPPNADWTEYCLGYCLTDTPEWRPDD